MTVRKNPLSRSLSGVKRTWLFAPHMSASDPKRTSCHGAKARLCIGLGIVVNRRGHMQRRGGSEQPVKGRRHRAIRPKARKAPIASVSAADLQEQLDRRTRELDEALQQQTATSEVLSSHSQIR